MILYGQVKYYYFQILVESQYMIDSLKKEIGAGLREHNICKWIDLAVGSVINQMLFDYRFSGVIFDFFQEQKIVHYKFYV